MCTEIYGDLLLPSGGYRRLKSFQLAQLVYDITVHFVSLYIPKESRTCDQMVQAARSGVQNIAEGSIDAATSTKLELNLYNAARASEKSFFPQFFTSPPHHPFQMPDDSKSAAEAALLWP